MPPSQKKLGKYSLERELGRGGMGVVYEALDTELNRKVALKLLLVDPLADDPEKALEEERFVREAQLSAKLKHPNIVTVYEAGSLEGRRYLSMQLVEGKSLAELLKAGAAGLRQKISLLREVALAVEHAHEQGILHRDLKPQNVLLDREGRPYVTDFGLAKRTGSGAAESLTISGSVVGTPAYMSPEQARGLKTLDARSDVYSLGIVLYELLTGRTPFPGETPLDVLMKVVNNPAPPPSSVAKNWEESAASDAIENICLKAIAKNPRERFPTAQAFADDLGRWLKGKQIQAAPPKAQGSPPWLWISIAAAVVVALGVVCLMPSDRMPLESPRKSARPPQVKAEPDPEKERLLRENQAALGEIERLKREASEREKSKIREAEIAKRPPEPVPKERPRVAEEEPRKETPPPKPVEEPARPPEPAPKPESPKVPPPAPPAAPRKLAEPAAAEARTAEKAVQVRFKEDYARKAPSERRTLAARLLEFGRKEDPDSTGRYALLQEARDLASVNGDPETSVAAVEELIRAFQIDPKALRTQTLQTLAKNAIVPTSMREAVAAGLRFVADAVAEDEYDAAISLLKQCDLLAGRAGDASLSASVRDRSREVTELRNAWVHVRAAFKALQEKPDDPALNLAAGRFLCFIKEEWERGLSYLVRSGDEPLKALAQRELAASTPILLLESGDAWSALPEKPPAKSRIADHALALYKRAWPAAQGTVKDALRAKFRAIAIRPGRVSPLPATPWLPGADSVLDPFALDDGCRHGGRVSLRIAASAKPGLIGASVKKIFPGRICTLSGWMLVDTPEPVGDILFVGVSDGKNADSVKNFITATPGDQPWWTYVQTTFTIPPGIVSMYVQLKYGFKTGSIWVDDLSCRLDDGTELFEIGGFEK